MIRDGSLEENVIPINVMNILILAIQVKKKKIFKAKYLIVVCCVRLRRIKHFN